MADGSLDELVVARAQRGDPRAFRALFEALAPGVRRFLGDLLRDASAADEATQETFVRAFQRLPQLRERERLKAWIFGIARMVSLEHLRRGRREALDDGAVPLRPDQSPGPEARLLAQESDRLLEGALAGLCPERRAALLLRIEQGLGYPDIAEAMGWPLQKVKNEIHRARLQLRTALQDHLEGAA